MSGGGGGGGGGGGDGGGGQMSRRQPVPDGNMWHQPPLAGNRRKHMVGSGEDGETEEKSVCFEKYSPHVGYNLRQHGRGTKH